VTTSTSRLKRMARSMPTPKKGAALFEGTTYPRTWADFVGNEEAVDYLRASCQAAKLRGARLEHTLIAAGTAGCGKSALARLVALEMDVGLVELQGDVDVSDVQKALASMHDGDILFLEEAQRLVSKSRARAEWLLSLMQDGVLVTGQGVEQVPDVTVLAATTDVQKLPETIISRFVVRPVLEDYSDIEAVNITRVTARRVLDHPGMRLPAPLACEQIARAGNNNPRQITALLRTLRDSVLSGRAIMLPVFGQECAVYELTAMYKWSGVAPDGLDRLAQRYLIELAVAGKPLAEKTVAALLGEPTVPRHTEKALMQRGLMLITPQGRELTPEGLGRAQEAMETLGVS